MTTTSAKLGLTSGASRVRQRVGFTTEGSTIAAGRHLRSATLNFGDRTSTSLKTLTSAPTHAYVKAGAYTATLSIVDSRGTASTTRRTVIVSGGDVARYRSTTRLVPAAAVVAVKNLSRTVTQVVLGAKYSAPKPGGTLVASPGGIVPQGVAVKVTRTSRGSGGTTIVVGGHATLSDIYSTLHISSSTTAGKQLIVADRRSAGSVVGSRTLSSSAVPFSCSRSGDNDRPLKVTADLSNTKIEPTIDLTSKIVQFIVISKPKLTLSASFSGSAQCSLGDYFALNIPIPSVPGLVVSISPYFSLSADGSIGAQLTYSPTFIMNITRSPGGDENYVFLHSAADASAGGSATLTLEGGVQLSISLGTAVGLQAQLGPKITVTASLTSAGGGQACISASSAIEATVSLFADVFFLKVNKTLFHGEYYRSTLFSRCTAAGAGSNGGASGGASGSGSGSGAGSPGGGAAGPSGPPAVSVANNNGQLAVQLANWPLGTTYYFCHFGDPSAYPRDGTVPNHGQFTLTSYSASFLRGLCSGEGNAWIGFQAPDGNDYYSDQTTLHYVPPTVKASNNNGQMAVSLSGFPVGTAYYFCHSGDPAGYPTGGTVTGRGRFTVTSSSTSFTSGLCAGSGNSWIGLQAGDGSDYYSNQTNLFYSPPTIAADNNNGQMTVQLGSFPLGTSYFFCHSGTPGQYPAGGVVTNHGQITVTDPNQYWPSGLCSGRGNAWIGVQATDGNSYYSSQTNLVAAQTPGAAVTVSNNNGQMVVQLTGFPTGVSYFFCHSGTPGQFPTGGVVTNHGQITITSPNQYWTSGLCSGRGNAWIGIQATDGADYYSNQTNLVAAQTAGASISAYSSGGQIYLSVSNFPRGTTYFFCHTGAPSQYPTGGSIANHGAFTVSSGNETFGPLCGGSGNFWIGIQATDGADYYSNQVQN